MSASISACVFVLLLNSLTKCEILLWGHDNLENVAPSSLAVFDDDYLNLIIDDTRPKRIVAFIDDGDERIANQNLPKFKQLVEECKSVYVLHDMPLVSLRDLPTVALDGTDSQKDEDITNTFQHLENKYGRGEVLAMLLNSNHRIQRRDVSFKASSNSTTSVFYNAPEKAVIYTRSYPVLRLDKGDGSPKEYVLKNAPSVTVDSRDSIMRLVVTFAMEDSMKITVKFRFVSQQGYWTLSVVEVLVESDTWILTTPREMFAPIGFSYHCGETVVFKNGSSSLSITDIQWQSTPVDKARFSDAYDCSGFMTVPIWSGLFVTAILAIGLAVGLIAITEIRTMDRFDDPKGKGLSIFVNEQ